MGEVLIFNEAPSGTIVGDDFGEDTGFQIKTPKTSKFQVARVKGQVTWKYKVSGDDEDDSDDDEDAEFKLKRLVKKNGKQSVSAELTLAEIAHGPSCRAPSSRSSDEFTTLRFHFKPDNNPDNKKFWETCGEGILALYYYAGDSRSELTFQDLHVEATLRDESMKLPPPLPVVEAKQAPAAVEATVRPSSTVPPKSTHGGKTYALVIGISKYITRGISPLDNATNDSRLIKQLLESRGVIVFYGEDCNSFEIYELRDKFLAALKPGDDAFIFFAGHGCEYKGVQRLLARALTKGEKMRREISSQTIAQSSLDLQQLIDSMEAKKTRVNVILLDCCRELLPHELARADVEQLDQAAMRALNPRAPEGTIIGFACDEHMLASDGFGSNGLYTSHLKDHLGNSLRDIETTLRLTGKGVEKDPHNTIGQKPRIKSNLTKEFVLFN